MRLAAALALAAGAAAASGPFDAADWREQRFSLFSRNAFEFRGDALAVTSEDSASMVWRPAPAGAARATRASWRWSVARSAPATDLTRKGGDDRNLGLFFLFAPEGAETGALSDLMDAPEARVLMYVWGGEHAPGTILPNPYLGDRGATVVLRPAGVGEAVASVDLSADFRAAFGRAPSRLMGLAVSADSDDTDSAVRATVSDLRLE